MYSDEDFAKYKRGEEICVVLNYWGMANYDMEHWKLRGLYLTHEKVVDYLHMDIDGDTFVIYAGHIGFIGKIHHIPQSENDRT